MAKTLTKPPTRKPASESNIEEKSSSDESVTIKDSDIKMAVKSPKTKIKLSKTKYLPKDPPKQPDLDTDPVEVLKIIPASSPAKPARKSKKLRIMHYKQKAHYFKQKFEGVLLSEIDDCSDTSYSSSEKERGMTYQYRV